MMENRYDKYKDSGIAWIGEIPEHWEIKRLKNVCSQVNIKENSKGNSLPYIGLENIESGSGRYIDTISEIEGMANRFCKNNVLFGKLRPYLSKVYLAEKDGICSTEFIVYDTKSNNCRFIHKLLLSPLFIDVVNSSTYGAKMPRANSEFINNIYVQIPPLPEQQSIATYLDQKCGEIDELITLQEEMITKLQSYKQSVITEAVTKGLDKNVPLKDSGIEWIGEIPEHWEVKRLKYFGNNYNGLTYSPNDICSSQEGIIVLRSSNIKDNKLCFDDNVYVNKEIPTKLLVNKGDILICSRNGSASLIGKAALIETDIKATFGAFMMIFRGNNICHKYLYYIVTSCISQYKWLFTTATINQLTSSMLGEIFAPFICNKLEQQSIADYLDQKCSEIDELISIKQQKIEKLKEYKKSLIFECVTGKRKVS